MNLSHEWLQTGVLVATFVISGIAAVVTVVWNVGRQIRELEEKYDAKLNLLSKELDDKRARIYERFDQYKAKTECEFVRREMCLQSHAGIHDEYQRMDKQFTDFRHDMRDAMSSMKIHNENMVNAFNDFRKEILEKVMAR